MGCGSSRAEAKRVRKSRGKEFDEGGQQGKENHGSGVGEIHKIFANGQERVLESRVFNLPAASAHGNSEGLTNILPEYMLNPLAKQHEKDLQQRYSETGTILPKALNGAAPNENVTSALTGTNYDGFSASIKYSLGLASIMNKYNIGSTNDIAEYKNNNIFIKTKKNPDEPKRPPSASQSVAPQKPNGVKLPPIEPKDRPSSSIKSSQAQPNNPGATNTLIFVQKKEKPKSVYSDEKDLLSTLVSLNIRPTQYFLSSIDVKELEGEQKPEKLAEDPNLRLKHVMLGADKEAKRKNLYQLIDPPQKAEYASDLLDHAFAEREPDEAKDLKTTKELSMGLKQMNSSVPMRVKDVKKSVASSFGGSRTGSSQGALGRPSSVNRSDVESGRPGARGQNG